MVKYVNDLLHICKHQGSKQGWNSSADNKTAAGCEHVLLKNRNVINYKVNSWQKCYRIILKESCEAARVFTCLYSLSPCWCEQCFVCSLTSVKGQCQRWSYKSYPPLGLRQNSSLQNTNNWSNLTPSSNTDTCWFAYEHLCKDVMLRLFNTQMTSEFKGFVHDHPKCETILNTDSTMCSSISSADWRWFIITAVQLLCMDNDTKASWSALFKTSVFADSLSCFCQSRIYYEVINTTKCFCW